MGKPAMGSPRVSVALATFNGSAYLQQQLDSYLAQTSPPVELVAVDDASTDNTLDILNAFSRCAPFAVRVKCNDSNLGPAATFAAAAALCSGDVIALSDQDDVWLPQKLERLGQLFGRDAELGAAFCNAELVDETLHSRGRDVWSLVGLTGTRRDQMLQGDALPVLLKRYSVQGATLVLLRSLITSALPIPPGWHHDAWLALVVAAESKVTGIPDCLQKYRQHGTNVIGARSAGLAAKLRVGWTASRTHYLSDESAKYAALIQRLRANGRASPEALRLIDAKNEHLARRAAMPASRMRRIPEVFAEIRSGGYSRYATDWRSIALDVLGR